MVRNWENYFLAFVLGVGLMLFIIGQTLDYGMDRCIAKNNVYSCKLDWVPVGTGQMNEE